MLLAALLALAVPAEDAAHRADRLRTAALNRAAAQAARPRPAVGDADRHARARARYQREMAAWRRAVAACRAGDVAECD